MEQRSFTQNDRDAFEKDGYAILRAFFSKEEATLLLEAAQQDKMLQQKTYGMEDASGKETRFTLWYNHGEDIYGAFSKNEHIINALEQLLGGEIALYHTKLMQKEPRVGGAWEWHQDYGYWYKNGFLFPDMLSVMVAVTTATIENGCLQVLKGSHKMGRIEHKITGSQNGADEERVKWALQIMQLEYVELEPGDVLIFHSNTLHRSDMNNSDHARWSLISAYNLTRNKPFLNEPPAAYTPVVKLPDTAIQRFASIGISEEAGFLTKEADKSIKG
jgi:ectoine hydroxylase-related dioxygenase (phytanoyl-CoA dioxygenase family)